MNTLSLIILILYVLVAQTVSFDVDYTLDPYTVNGIIAWTEPNCQGIAASTIFNGSTLAKNISNVCLARSFQLLRPLQGQEQLDISITQEPSLWHPYERGVNSLPCTSFIQSYFPINGSDRCYNTSPFTCHRMWINYGLDPALRVSKLSTTWAFLSTLPTIIPSACFLPSSTSISASSTTSSPLFPLSASATTGMRAAELSPLPSTTSPRTSGQQNPLPSSEVAKTTFHLSCFTGTSIRASTSSAMYISSYASASTHVTTGTPSSRTVTTSSRSFTQMVRVEPGNPTKFVPQTLDVSIGDTVWFYSLNGSFLLYNTSLEWPCNRLERYGDDAYKHVIFQVNTTEPLWLIGLQNRDGYPCCPSNHFALNPGTQTNKFFDSINHSCINITYPVATPQPTITATVVVHPNGDVVTTLIS